MMTEAAHNRCGARAIAASTSPLPTENSPIRLVWNCSWTIGCPGAAPPPGQRPPAIPQIPAHQFGRVFGLIASFRDDDRDRLADMADLVMRQQWLPRAQEFMLDGRRPFARRRDLPLGHRRKHRNRSAPLSAQITPGAAMAADKIDRANSGMRDRAAHQHRMQHARQHEIGDELPLTGQQPVVFAPRQ
jgi:hypothetical protein